VAERIIIGATTLIFGNAPFKSLARLAKLSTVTAESEITDPAANRV